MADRTIIRHRIKNSFVYRMIMNFWKRMLWAARKQASQISGLTEEEARRRLSAIRPKPEDPLSLKADRVKKETGIYP